MFYSDLPDYQTDLVTVCSHDSQEQAVDHEKILYYVL